MNDSFDWPSSKTYADFCTRLKEFNDTDSYISGKLNVWLGDVDMTLKVHDGAHTVSFYSELGAREVSETKASVKKDKIKDMLEQMKEGINILIDNIDEAVEEVVKQNAAYNEWDKEYTEESKL